MYLSRLPSPIVSEANPWIHLGLVASPHLRPVSSFEPCLPVDGNGVSTSLRTWQTRAIVRSKGWVVDGCMFIVRWWRVRAMRVPVPVPVALRAHV